MRRRLIAAALFGVLVGGATLAAVAAEPKPATPKDESRPPAYTEAKAAPADFAVQGEYVGRSSSGQAETFAAQIASLGKGQFAAAFYRGGLPGDGWDGKSRFESGGKATDETMTRVDFAPAGAAGFTGTWSGGVLKGKTDTGVAFELTRLERKSPTFDAKPPQDATVLFDGTNTDAWENGKMDGRKLLETGTKTKKKYQSFTLHLEFIEPFKPLGREQDRGNSGVYIQDRYEVQVLDSFGEKPTFNGTASIYRQHAPAVNMCYPPLQWQTYDIEFTAPVFDGEKKTKNAVITVKLNGVVVQDKYEITAKTGAGKPEGPAAGPIQLQAHNNPVFYRNVWIVEGK